MEYSRRNGRAPLLALLPFPLAFWWFVRPRTAEQKAKEAAESETKHWSVFTLILFVVLVMFGTCAFIFGQLYLSYEFLREGGALG
ncbi:MULTISPECIES: hypothetical protein [unclassified Pseudoclavibacter]|uniref:hypothetical protein n=1 Tax=unclassified Pseudoclavibacter TaxID=2615177 RepID=UPI0013017F27|nr:MULTISPECIES: hypothetical protein [unclassified Pseudoclavibacter]KAB1645476.1 hypothetical protein F8O06_07750 [Pseudoclavibacter sp. CFCC 14310]KAB1646065.1 hypothetical protein F8O06_04695 [Pseudoclavibacter sp. CFCC 14310]KAB1663627.1 hypothetical protein F8O08_07850 [Pseudoclavibacter sp. CFCC 13611]